MRPADVAYLVCLPIELTGEDVPVVEVIERCRRLAGVSPTHLEVREGMVRAKALVVAFAEATMAADRR